jgi:murein DD-endopeptidase MepM/ murein hydrolase activator NlpD
MTRVIRISRLKVFLATWLIGLSLVLFPLSGHPVSRAAGLTPAQRQLQTILSRRHYWQQRLKSEQHQEWRLQTQLTTTHRNLSHQEYKLRNERARSATQQLQLLSALQNDQQQVQSVRTQLDTTRIRYRAVHKQAEALLIRLRQLKARIKRELGHVREALVQIYELSQVSPLESVLQAGSLTDLLRQQSFVSEIGAQDTAILKWARNEHTLVFKAASVYLAKMRELRALQAQEADQLKLVVVETQRENLLLIKARRLTQRRQESIRRMEDSIRTLARQEHQELTGASNAAQTDQKAIVQDQQAAERVAYIIGQESGVYPDIGGAPGTLQWPVVGPITQGFGPSPYAFEPAVTYHGVFYPHFHTGIDIAAPFQTPIRAAGAGRVIFASLFVPGQPHVSYGLCVIIMHSGRLSTLYAHLDNALGLRVQVGQVVAAGQIIGYEGVTGNTTGPHLHFEVRVNEIWVNPLTYLPPEPTE